MSSYKYQDWFDFNRLFRKGLYNNPNALNILEIIKGFCQNRILIKHYAQHSLTQHDDIIYDFDKIKEILDSHWDIIPQWRPRDMQFVIIDLRVKISINYDFFSRKFYFIISYHKYSIDYDHSNIDEDEDEDEEFGCERPSAFYDSDDDEMTFQKQLKISCDSFGPIYNDNNDDTMMEDYTTNNLGFRKFKTRFDIQSNKDTDLFTKYFLLLINLHNYHLDVIVESEATNKSFIIKNEKFIDYKVWMATILLQRWFRGILTRNKCGVHNPHCEIGKKFLIEMGKKFLIDS